MQIYMYIYIIWMLNLYFVSTSIWVLFSLMLILDIMWCHHLLGPAIWFPLGTTDVASFRKCRRERCCTCLASCSVALRWLRHNISQILQEAGDNWPWIKYNTITKHNMTCSRTLVLLIIKKREGIKKALALLVHVWLSGKHDIYQANFSLTYAKRSTSSRQL